MKLGSARAIGLLSPCGWGNLGDACIQDAAIGALRRRITEVRLVGFTLNPKDTTERHGIPAYPISGYSNTGYRIAGWQPSALGKLPVVGRFFRTLLGVLAELRHLPLVWHWAGELDLLLVSGGGQLDEFWGGPWGHPYALWKWTLICRLRGTPVAFLSVGLGVVQSGAGRAFTRAALTRAFFHSYRDSRTRDWVRALGVPGEHRVVPDLAYGYPAVPAAPPGGPTLTVGVSPIAYQDPRVWPIESGETYDAYVARMAEFCGRLLRAGHRILFFATAGADRRTIADVKARLGAAGASVLEPAITSVSEALRELAGTDCVVASRLHSVVLAHLAGRPALALSYDWKVARLMDDAGQSDVCLELERASVDDISGAFARLTADLPGRRAALARTLESWRPALDRQYDEVLE